MASFKFYVTYIFSRNLLFRVYGIFPPVLPLTREKLSHIIHTPFKKSSFFFHIYISFIHLRYTYFTYSQLWNALFRYVFAEAYIVDFLHELIFCTDKLNIPFLVFHSTRILYVKTFRQFP